MKEKEIYDEGLVIYGEYQKSTCFPNEYEDLIDHIMSLFQIPEEKKPLLIITYKNVSGDSIKITSQEDYSEFLLKKSKGEIQNIISISLQEFIKNEIKSFRDTYDKDEEEDDNDKDDLFLRQGHVFNNKNEKQKSEIFGGGRLDINKFLNESIEFGNSDDNNINNNINNNKNNNFEIDNIFSNTITKSVLPPVISFPSYCNICQKFPIVKVMFFCLDCQLNLCEDCEKNLGYNHRHCYYKIRNKEQYQEILKMEAKEDDLNNKIKNESEKDKKIKDKSVEKKEGLNGIFSSILGFMSGPKNNDTK